MGSIVAIGEKSMTVLAQGGHIEVLRVRPEDDKKMPAAQFCAEANIGPGTLLGS